MAAHDTSNVAKFSPKPSLVKIGLSKSGFDNFLSGFRIAFSFGNVVVYAPRSQDAEIGEVWGSVGNFIAEAMQGAAGANPALPRLPEDLFSAPVSGVAVNEQERELLSTSRTISRSGKLKREGLTGMCWDWKTEGSHRSRMCRATGE